MKSGEQAFTLIPVDSSSIAIASVIAFIAVLDAEYPTPKILRYGKLGSAFLASEPAPLETLTIRAAGASRSRGSIAWYTASTPKTLVSQIVRTSVSETLLGRFNFEYSSTVWLGSLLVFEMAALFTSTSSRPSSLRMRSAAAAIEA